MNLLNAIFERHSVRHYIDKEIPVDVQAKLNEEATKINAQSGLNVQLFFNEPEGFSKCLLNYGKLTGVVNYIALVGKDCDKTDFDSGYYGERLVLLAQTLGLNTCWVALTFNKAKCKAVVKNCERLALVIALGYGQTQGVSHKSKPMEKLCADYDTAPDWFRNGMDTAILAPTALNQQKFYFTCLSDGKVRAQKGKGFYSRVDLGIVCHDFEIGADRKIDWEFNVDLEGE